MKIIGNISTNHMDFMRNLSADADELVFFSPFCYQDFGDFFQEIITANIKNITLVTTLKPDGALYKSNSLVSFIDELNTRAINWKISIDNKLHGKMYFFLTNGIIKNAIITSANLTDNGMIRNHEWGCVINDTIVLDQLYKEAMSGVELSELTEDHVIKLMFAVDEYKKNNPITKITNEQIDINKIIEIATGIKFTPETRIFLKPYGSTDDKIFEGDFSEKNQMYFSRRRPNSVRVNDLLICYAVGATKITSVFKVISEPRNTENETDRWPWYVEVENLTPEYGRKWFKSDNTLSKVQHDFLSISSKNYLTYNGGKTLGAFQFGSDKIRLNDDFGKYLIKLIEKKIG